MTVYKDLETQKKMLVELLKKYDKLIEDPEGEYEKWINYGKLSNCDFCNFVGVTWMRPDNCKPCILSKVSSIYKGTCCTDASTWLDEAIFFEDFDEIKDMAKKRRGELAKVLEGF